MPFTSKQVRLRSRPSGLPDSETWEVGTVEIADPAVGEVVIAVDHVSIDPAMRGWLNETRSYLPPVAIGEVMRAAGTGVVVASNCTDWSVGEAVTGLLGVTEYALSDGSGLERIDTTTVPAPTWLGTFGLAGMTAYFGLVDVGRAAPGETVVVTAAAGAVGSITGQLAKATGCTVVGIAGSDDKCEWLRSIGFDEVINYKTENVLKRLRAVAPDGIDVFFDNVGGDLLDAGLANLRHGARVVLCGAVSTYNESTLPPGPRRYMSLLVFRATMTGFVVFDYESRFATARNVLSGLLADGSMVAKETIVEGGVEAFGEALRDLFEGRNTGKLVLQL